jgi:hypothetical protein
MLLETVVEVVKTPEAIRAIRNLLLLSKALGDMEPELLDVVVRALPEGLAHCLLPEANSLVLAKA